MKKHLTQWIYASFHCTVLFSTDFIYFLYLIVQENFEQKKSQLNKQKTHK